ncbi:NAD(P)-dependent alcohol dehydrogenase [Paucibacter sp. DJ1R-11]|uniref:NAD(P)-dependent alcohol dehydrogenase n=1 Tax=Paucibacter sp. DJ1R-11 TaxID=2893556 RepID=UPI0021E3D0BC|nr:NAD(P)-dependent alcohol dehydrogenase [Paucibacter sp. DJ1R-11]MCV2365089.1 NAD(P)-dependent alcohol dehydrogenase [Paucibacter sp. DJ1R-11]
MKSAYRSHYGHAEVLSLRELERPSPKADELLIRVRAATVSRTDGAILQGRPWLMRCFCGLLRPRSTTPGCDFAGEVMAVGERVTRFKVGERLFGFDDLGLGSHSQYLCLAESKALARIPEGVSFEHAAASAEGAHYAINFLNKVGLESGQTVLLNGATGAIGSALLQLLKQRGARVTATCPGAQAEWALGSGAERVIDFQKQDFTHDPTRYDFVFDAVGKSSFGRCRPLLKPGAVYISSELGPYAQNLGLALCTPWLGGRKVVFPVPLRTQASLDLMQGLLAQGAFKPLIDRRFPLAEIQAAYRLTLSGAKIGNVLVTMD